MKVSLLFRSGGTKLCAAGVAGIVLALYLATLDIFAVAAAQTASGLPIPRFVSLAADRVNLRTGPGRRYPVEWVYVRAGTPLEVIAEYEHWRRIRDAEGTVGWVHKSLLSGRRTVIVTGATRPVRDKPEAGSRIVLYADPGVYADLVSCRGRWCNLVIEGRRGWLLRSAFWGVYKNEDVN
ncbi:MAG: SH3 domain-containing protein [Sphingomonadales bacterium]